MSRASAVRRVRAGRGAILQFPCDALIATPRWPPSFLPSESAPPRRESGEAWAHWQAFPRRAQDASSGSRVLAPLLKAAVETAESKVDRLRLVRARTKACVLLFVIRYAIAALVRGSGPSCRPHAAHEADRPRGQPALHTGIDRAPGHSFQVGVPGKAGKPVKPVKPVKPWKGGCDLRLPRGGATATSRTPQRRASFRHTHDHARSSA